MELGNERAGRDDWIKFGPRDSQIVSPETASIILRKLRKSNPKLFGNVLRFALLATDDELNEV